MKVSFSIKSSFVLLLFQLISPVLRADEQAPLDIFFNNWTPPLSAREKAMFMQDELNGRIRIKDSGALRGLECSEREAKQAPDEHEFVIDTEDNVCSLSEIKGFGFSGLLTLPKDKQRMKKYLMDNVQRVKKLGFENFTFVFGYDNEVKSRLNRFNIEFKNYIPSGIEFQDYMEYVEITLMESQNVHGVDLKKGTKIRLFKGLREYSPPSVVIPHGQDLKYGNLKCSALILDGSGPDGCTLAKEANLQGSVFPEATQLELSNGSWKNKNLSISSAVNYHQNMQVGTKVVPRGSKVIFSGKKFKVLPPEKQSGE